MSFYYPLQFIFTSVLLFPSFIISILFRDLLFKFPYLASVRHTIDFYEAAYVIRFDETESVQYNITPLVT